MTTRMGLLRRLGLVAAVWAGLWPGVGLPPPAPAADTPSPSNVVPITMRTPRSGFNRLVVTVTVCRPGTAVCTTIDNVMVDTGSTGLRLEASAVPAWLHLPAIIGTKGKPLAECLYFVHDTAWGSLAGADLRIGGMAAASLPIQIIADDSRSWPDGCPHSDVRPTSNGTLGIGPQLFDCQGSCEQSPSRPGVFENDAGVWSPVAGAVDASDRLPNPVSRFTGHDNGVVFDLPVSPSGGAAALTGTLTFGVGTAGNNRLGAARVLPVSGSGRFTTFYRGEAYPESYIDSGTETYIFSDDRLPRCERARWAYCVEPRRSLDAELVGRDGGHLPLRFAVGDYQTMRIRMMGASDSDAVAAEPSSKAFVWGAPLFSGRRVFVIFEGKVVPGETPVSGPAYALDQPSLTDQ